MAIDDVTLTITVTRAVAQRCAESRGWRSNVLVNGKSTPNPQSLEAFLGLWLKGVVTQPYINEEIKNATKTLRKDLGLE